MALTPYGDISPRTAAYAQKELLKRGIPHMNTELFGQGKPVPLRSSTQTKFRRYEALDNTPNAITEGVTPASKSLTHTDITANLIQYGDRIELSDIVIDTHEDPVLMEAVEILGEQAAQMIEIIRFAVLKAGTNVFYANGVARNAVNTKMTRALQRNVTRAMNRQNARTITKRVASTPSYGTVNVKPSYIALVHTDVETDIRDMQGFKAVEDYGSLQPYDNEIGAVENVRYLSSSLYVPYPDAGGLDGDVVLSSTGTNADVYPIVFLSADSYGIVPLKGKAAITPMIVNPKPCDSDPMGQRGHAAWKSMQTCVILNELWLARAEVAVSV
ncbi:MAG: N4-gp56 family major capsid protein [Gammaproteobacteria bacterium]|nr:N4-gp56 family major capsid protein [Gammaproteobacteria bacterium]